MTARRFTKGVVAETRARAKPRVEQFGRLLPGDEWSQVVLGRKSRQRVRFVYAEVDADGTVVAVTVTTLLNGHLRTLAPDAVDMPSQRALNAQRRRRAAEEEAAAAQVGL